MARSANWLWTARGRAASAILAAAPLALAAWIKWSSVRDVGPAATGAIRWVLGWAPSFLASFALPYLVPLFGRRPFASSRWPAFAPECAAAAAVLAIGELSDALFPQVGSTSVQTFDGLDLVAIVIGAGSAFGVAHRSPSTSARPDAPPD